MEHTMGKFPSHKAGAVRIRALAGPDLEDRYRWRAEWHAGRQLCTKAMGWLTTGQAFQVAEQITKGGGETAQAPAQVLTVCDLLEVWMAVDQVRQDIRKATKIHRMAVAKRLVRELGSVHLARLNLGVLEDYKNRMLRSGLATGTIIQDKKVLSKAWEHARQMGWVPDRALPRLAIQHTPVLAKYTPTPFEVDQVAGPMDGAQRVLFLLLAATGCRIGEGAGLTWERVDLDAGWLTVIGKKPEPRDVPIGPGLHELLTAYREEGSGTGPVFGSAIVASRATRHSMHKAQVKLEITHFSFNGLRRLAVDEMQRAGVDVGTAAALTGHSPTVMLVHYRQATRADLRAALRRSGLGAKRTTGQIIRLPNS
jgi:integrase